MYMYNVHVQCHVLGINFASGFTQCHVHVLIVYLYFDMYNLVYQLQVLQVK